MDKAVSIERRLAAMKAFHDAGVRTTCFISPIFPGISEVEEIIERVKGQCNVVWLENLNLRGGYRKTVMGWIASAHPELLPLYDEFFSKGRRDYWQKLDSVIRTYCKREGLDYLRDDDSMARPFDAPPVVVNFFYHEELTKSAKRKAAKEMS